MLNISKEQYLNSYKKVGCGESFNYNEQKWLAKKKEKSKRLTNFDNVFGTTKELVIMSGNCKHEFKTEKYYQ